MASVPCEWGDEQRKPHELSKTRTGNPGKAPARARRGSRPDPTDGNGTAGQPVDPSLPAAWRTGATHSDAVGRPGRLAIAGGACPACHRLPGAIAGRGDDHAP